MSGTFSFGLWRVNDLHLQSYKDGVVVQSGFIGSQPLGDKTWIGVLANSGAYVSRIEWRDTPGGTIIDADDFTADTGWSTFGGASLVESFSGGELFLRDIGSTSSGIYKNTPAGADYVELQGVHMAAEIAPDWVMVALKWNPAGPTIGGPPGSYGSPGLRVLMREVHPHNVEIPDLVSSTPPVTLGSPPLLRQRQTAA